jgi:hypothetical protein
MGSFCKNRADGNVVRFQFEFIITKITITKTKIGTEREILAKKFSCTQNSIFIKCLQQLRNIPEYWAKIHTFIYMVR